VFPPTPTPRTLFLAVGDLVRVRYGARAAHRPDRRNPVRLPRTSTPIKLLPIDGDPARAVPPMPQAWQEVLPSRWPPDCHTVCFKTLKTSLPPGWLGTPAPPRGSNALSAQWVALAARWAIAEARTARRRPCSSWPFKTVAGWLQAVVSSGDSAVPLSRGWRTRISVLQLSRRPCPSSTRQASTAGSEPAMARALEPPRTTEPGPGPGPRPDSHPQQTMPELLLWGGQKLVRQTEV